MTFVLTVLTGIIDPVLITVLSATMFPEPAQGSLIARGQSARDARPGRAGFSARAYPVAMGGNNRRAGRERARTEPGAGRDECEASRECQIRMTMEGA